MPSWTQAMMNYDRNLDHEDIDEFLAHLEFSTKRRMLSLEKEYNSLSEGQFADLCDLSSYQDHLSEQASSIQSAIDLGGQLSIIALYKKVEAKTIKVVASKLPSTSSKNLSYFNQLRAALPFDINTVKGFTSFNELRLLNNSIKHGGEVSKELSSAFPTWIFGAKIETVGDAYNRLLPGVVDYVFDLVNQIYAQTKL